MKACRVSNRMKPRRIRALKTNIDATAKHVFDKQGVPDFAATTITGLRPDGVAYSRGTIDPSFWTNTVFVALPASWGVGAIGQGATEPAYRIMTRLGTDYYRVVMTLAGKGINGAKGQLWGYKVPTREAMLTLLSDQSQSQTTAFFDQIRYVSYCKLT